MNVTDVKLENGADIMRPFMVGYVSRQLFCNDFSTNFTIFE